MLWTYGGGFAGGVASVYAANNIIAQSVQRVGFSNPVALLLRPIMRARGPL